MVREDIRDFVNTIPRGITIVAATKYVGVDDLITLFNNGIHDFGENRVDSFLQKYEAMKNYPLTWHFIGHLQRNKAEKVIDKIDYLHSLDSLDLAKIINTHRSTPLKCFIEVSVNHEESKNGVPYEEVEAFVKAVLHYPHIQLVGLMMMAVKASKEDSSRGQFARLATLRDKLEQEFSLSLPYLSMGMSEDYQEAIQEGATHIRLGRILFKML